jgi:hypothetical protein
LVELSSLLAGAVASVGIELFVQYDAVLGALLLCKVDFVSVKDCRPRGAVEVFTSCLEVVLHLEGQVGS